MAGRAVGVRVRVCIATKSRSSSEVETALAALET
jgi:hypothetical protein